jgi:hypothetical protein
MPNLLDLIASPKPELETYPRPRTGLLGRLEHPEVYLKDQPLSAQDELRGRGLDELRFYGSMPPSVADALREQQRIRTSLDANDLWFQQQGMRFPPALAPANPYQPSPATNPYGESAIWERESDDKEPKKKKKAKAD